MLGIHYYSQLSKSEDLLKSDPKALDSVGLIVTGGAYVSDSFQANYFKYMTNLKVRKITTSN